jgi:DNA (cytosine-5)-methyltransferase 1
MCPVATETYRDNFPDAHVETGRLEKLNLSAVRKQVGSIDILLASPECTNHSHAKGSARRSEESRATAMQVVRYAREFRPRWLVLENVVNMRPWLRYTELKAELTNLGYRLGEQVLDASDFGVAQTRTRLFLVGDRKGEPGLVDRKRPGRRKSVKSILDNAGTWEMTPLKCQGRAVDTLARAERAFKILGHETPFLIVYYGTDGSGGWQPLTRPLRTITTVDRFALVEPSTRGPQMRMLQVPELRRAMGFDTGYIMNVGTRRDRVRMLGNGVCPPVMTEVVSALISG